MMEGSGWRASGYLGIITAGALWTRLSDESQFEENIRQLHGQVQKVIGAGLPADLGTGGDDEGVATASEAKEELERLRDDLVESQSAVGAVLAGPSEPATIPAGVPKLPSKFTSTEQIQELTKLVQSTASADMSMSHVGFWGMGGIGKTVTGAAIVRDAVVRAHFHIVIWLPLGQTPVISKLQNLCHMQCTGKELSSELSSDEKKEALKQAMSGKRVLLCLDDLWEEEHELELNFADVSAGSKVLISTRMKALLTRGHQVEVGLPSPSDSARMLLSAADADTSGRQPTGVSDIVDLCGRLPLALGIAGRLAASLELVGTSDWRHMINVLKEELRECHSGRTEEGMIRASLRGLKGSPQEQENVRALLLLFAFVPEDTHCPLEVLLLMFKAVYASSAATLMHMRKWLRILINRSLVLGTIDRPSVHDLVLEFAVAQHTDDALRQAHRSVVEAFRACRPEDVHGRRQFESTASDDPLLVYVSAEVEHHVRNGWLPNMEDDSLACTSWLGDMPQDAIVAAAGRVLGRERLSTMAAAAEAARDWWLAARYFGLLQTVLLSRLGLSAAGVGPTVAALGAMEALGPKSFRLQPEKEDFHLALVATLASGWDTTGDLAQRPSVVEHVLSTPATARNPMATSIIMYISSVIGLVVATKNHQDAMKIGEASRKVCLFLADHAVRPTHDATTREKCLHMLYNLGNFSETMHMLPDYDWDATYGEQGRLLNLAVETYTYERTHLLLTKALTCDWIIVWATTCVPVAYHYGDMEALERNWNMSMLNMNRIITEPERAVEAIGVLTGPCIYATFAWSCRLPASHREAVAGLLEAAQMTWSTADATIDELVPVLNGIVRARGDRTMDTNYVAGEQYSIMGRCSYILMADDAHVPDDAIMAGLPSVEECGASVVTMSNIGSLHNSTQGQANTFLCCAAVCEKLGRYAEALAYAEAGCDFRLIYTVLVTVLVGD